MALTVAITLSPGATNGPVDMSVTCGFYAVELGVLIELVTTADVGGALRTRLLAAEANCESQGSITCQLTLSPLEQGLLLGALNATTCRFCGTLRQRIFVAVTSKLASLGGNLDS